MSSLQRAAPEEGGVDSDPRRRPPLASCWDMFHLPPFYTKQPVAETFESQAFMWAEVIFGLCQASLHTESSSLEASLDGIDDSSRQCCPFAALVTCSLSTSSTLDNVSSPIFFNQKLLRRAPPSVVRRAMYLASTELYPNFCLTNVTSAGSAPTIPDEGGAPSLTSDGKNPWLLVLLGNCQDTGTSSSPDGSSSMSQLNTFSLRSLRERLLQWVMEEGGGYTLPNLLTKGVVATFEELVDGDVLRYGVKKATLSTINHTHSLSVRRHLPISVATSSSAAGDSSTDRPAAAAVLIPCPPRSSTAVTYEAVLRIIINKQLGIMAPASDSTIATNPLSAAHIELFNLDGTNTLPFEGVKFGGK